MLLPTVQSAPPMFNCFLRLSIGLHLKNGKSEIICHDPVVRGTILFSLPGRVVDPSDACFLGSPIGNLDSVTAALRGKINSLEIMGETLSHVSAQDALILLCNAFSIPKLLYILRTSPSFLSPALDSYDESLKSIVSRITNIHFEANDPAWSQATLPVGVGGLGIRSTVQLTPSAFLASASATHDLVQEILPLCLQPLTWLMLSHRGQVFMTINYLLVLQLVSRRPGMLTKYRVPWTHSSA